MLFDQEERRIFGPYFNGAQDIYGDPLAIDRKLRALLGDTEELFARYRSRTPAALEAAEQFNAAIIHAFGVVPFDPLTGQGLAEDDLVKLWNGFQGWLRGKEPRAESSPTVSPPTVAESASSSAQHSPAVRADTPPSLLSSSTLAACASGAPGK